MRCLLIDSRSRLYIVGLEGGVPILGADRDLALRFRSADDARTWIAENSSTFGEFCLLRDESAGEPDATRAAHHKR